MPQFPSAGHEEAWRVVESINRAWMAGDLEGIAACFHEELSIAGPSLEVLTRGRRESVASYEEFLGQATLHGFEAGEPEVALFGDTAVVSYPFEVDYERADGRWQGGGRDLFVLARRNRRWRAVWRVTSPGEETRVTGAPS